MPHRIILTVITGNFAGKVFIIEKHDTFLFGRQKECHICLPDDKTVSRHHFLLEVNPPQARLHDLGSRNGTFVNGVRYGGRLKHETPGEGGRYHYLDVDLHHNDEILVGDTILRFEVQHQQASRVVACQQCGQNISVAADPEQEDDVLCARCRKQIQNDPITPLFRLFAEASSQAHQGIQLADYQVQRKLGEGGMGAVYLIAPKAKVQGYEMALKVMSPKTTLDAHAKQAFLREIESTQALKHTNIVGFLGSGVEQNTFYFLLEYCRRGNISNLIEQRGGRLTLAEAGPIMLQALKGLAYAHQKGFVHRDIKPHNILLSSTEGRWHVKIADFGLAKNFIDAGLSGMTISGDGFAGSLLFMAREQLIDFKYTKPTSDVWSMGATFYFMLTGRFPRPNKRERDEQDPLEVILHESAIPLRQTDPQISPALAAIIDRSLAFDPEDRYQTANDMLDPLARLLKKLH